MINIFENENLSDYIVSFLPEKGCIARCVRRINRECSKVVSIDRLSLWCLAETMTKIKYILFTRNIESIKYFDETHAIRLGILNQLVYYIFVNNKTHYLHYDNSYIGRRNLNDPFMKSYLHRAEIEKIERLCSILTSLHVDYSYDLKTIRIQRRRIINLDISRLVKALIF